MKWIHIQTHTHKHTHSSNAVSHLLQVVRENKNCTYADLCSMLLNSKYKEKNNDNIFICLQNWGK